MPDQSTRRAFLAHAAALGATAGEAIPLRHVSAFRAPFLAARLHPGARLEVLAVGSRVYLTQKGAILGLLPPHQAREARRALAQGGQPAFVLAGIWKDPRGRLQLTASRV